MKRTQPLFVATTDDGEMFHLLDEFASYRADALVDGEDQEFEIEQWEAGYIMMNNSELKEYDPEYYINPLQLWNELQNQVAWQKRRGVTSLETARQLVIQDVAEIIASRAARPIETEAG